MENTTNTQTLPNTIARLAGLLSLYSYHYQKERVFEKAEALGRYLGYLDALRDNGYLDFWSYANLTGLYLSVQVYPLDVPKTLEECSELVRQALNK